MGVDGQRQAPAALIQERDAIAIALLQDFNQN
jgi:hypothetical protein